MISMINSTFFLYITIDLIAILFLFLYNHFNNVNINTRYKYRYLSLLFLILSFIVLFFFSAFRDHVGRDYNRYVEIYNLIGENILSTADISYLKQGILFWFICKILNLLNLNYYWMFTVISFITLYYFYKGVIKSSNHQALSLFIILSFCLYYQSFNQIRQMAAVAIIFYALGFLMENKIKRFIIYVLIASCFHLSALITLLILLVKDIKITRSNLFIYSLIAIFFYWTFDSIITIINRLSIFNYISIYSNSSMYSSSFSLSTIQNSVIRLIMLIISLLFSNRVLQKKNLSFLYNTIILCTILQIGAIKFYIFGRITTYFYTAYIYLIPYLLDAIRSFFKKNSRFIINNILYLMLFIYHIVYYLSSSGAIAAGYEIYRSII